MTKLALIQSFLAHRRPDFKTCWLHLENSYLFILVRILVTPSRSRVNFAPNIFGPNGNKLIDFE